MIREIDPKFKQFHTAHDKTKASLAKAISSLHDAWRSQYGDFALPTQSRRELVKPLSKETQKLIEQMRNDGYAVYETEGLSPAVLRSDGMPFWSLNSRLENSGSDPALVALRPEPSRLFLPGSKSLPYGEQLKLIPEEQARIDGAYPNAGLKIREGREWPELAWKHFKATGTRLFGTDFDYAYTWMPIYESDDQGARRAIAGRWGDRFGFFVDFDRPDRVGPGLGLAFLVEIPWV